MRRVMQRHPHLTNLVPVLLERGDPIGRGMALQVALLIKTPQLLVALRDFALGQHGPDSMRNQAAQAAADAGLIPPGLVHMWIQGQWMDVLLLNFEITPEPTEDYHHSPQVEKWSAEALEALHAGEWERGERLLKQALEAEPDSPDLLNNLAMAYQEEGREDESLELIRQIHERFPDYLFARVALATLYAQDGKVDKSRALLEPLLKRKQFHYSEFAALSHAQVELSLAEGKPEGARAWVDMLKGMDPDNPLVKELQRRINLASRLPHRLRRSFSRRGRDRDRHKRA